MFFQWRQSKAGAEKHHSGMVPHGGTDTRVWREVKALGNELPKLDSVLTSQVKADVAILMDWNNWWALELDSKPSSDLKLIPQLYQYYKPLFDRNITVDFAHPESDLSKYKLVIAPNLYLVNDASAKNINQYVQNGGNLLMSFFSGIVNENEHIRLGGYPAPFREMLGLVVEEFAPYSETQTNSIRTSDGKQFNAHSGAMSCTQRMQKHSQPLNRIITQEMLQLHIINSAKAMPSTLAHYLRRKAWNGCLIMSARRQVLTL